MAKSAPNGVLAALPGEVWEQIRSRVTEKRLPRATTILRPGMKLSEVYFPVTGIVSVVSFVAEESMAEIATIGREGMVGPEALLGSEKLLWHYHIQVPGSALTLSYQDLEELLQQFPALRSLLQKYLEAYLLNVSQMVICNAVHSAHQRTARWLLTCNDRSGGPFMISQELLADMLGVSRPVVTMIAREFQRKGLIEYYRARIKVSNHDGLRAESCRCYEVIRDAHQERGFLFRPGQDGP